MYTIEHPTLGISLELERLKIPALDLDDWKTAIVEMENLEKGAIANPTEKRMVGHYWLRNPRIAPPDIASEIRKSWQQLEKMNSQIPEKMENLLMIGIGGSALGPQLLVDALESHDMRVYFLDNTDPDGIDRILSRIDLTKTMVAVLSKSGGTKETRNALLETREYFREQELDFTKQAIAITVEGSQLDQQAEQEGWFARLPLWNWVGGRTSITGVVGLLPLLLMKRDWRAFLKGAAEMDQWTRVYSASNPALQIAHAWYCLGKGQGDKSMVVLPYKDSLQLFGRYLQQLIMESIGKKEDRDGNIVHQGLTVYGNKGSTDQHAFVQQLRDGRDDFFVNFIAVLQGREKNSIEVEDGFTSGDYLLGFLLGTRNALTEAERASLTLIIEKIDERHLGALIALYERVVGFYASRLNLNAYDQPGVEAGKKGAQAILELQRRLMEGEKVPDNDDTRIIRRYLSTRK